MNRVSVESKILVIVIILLVLFSTAVSLLCSYYYLGREFIEGTKLPDTLSSEEIEKLINGKYPRYLNSADMDSIVFSGYVIFDKHGNRVCDSNGYFNNKMKGKFGLEISDVYDNSLPGNSSALCYSEKHIDGLKQEFEKTIANVSKDTFKEKKTYSTVSHIRSFTLSGNNYYFYSLAFRPSIYSLLCSELFNSVIIAQICSFFVIIVLYSVTQIRMVRVDNDEKRRSEALLSDQMQKMIVPMDKTRECIDSLIEKDNKEEAIKQIYNNCKEILFEICIILSTNRAIIKQRSQKKDLNYKKIALMFSVLIIVNIMVLYFVDKVGFGSFVTAEEYNNKSANNKELEKIVEKSSGCDTNYSVLYENEDGITQDRLLDYAGDNTDCLITIDKIKAYLDNYYGIGTDNKAEDVAYNIFEYQKLFLLCDDGGKIVLKKRNYDLEANGAMDFGLIVQEKRKIGKIEKALSKPGMSIRNKNKYLATTPSIDRFEKNVCLMTDKSGEIMPYYAYYVECYNNMPFLLFLFGYKFQVFISVINSIFLLLGIWIALMLLEKQNKKMMQAKILFASAVAHDLKTPVTIIMNRCEVLNEGIAVDKMQDYLESMRKQIDKILALQNHVYIYHNLSDANSIIKEKVSLSEVVTLSIESNMDFAEMKDITLITEIDDDKAYIFANKELISLAVNNYIVNAIKYSENGSEVNAKLEKNKKECRFTTINPLEHGTTLNTDKFWDVLYQHDEARTYSGQSGMGLPVNKRIFEAHGFKYGCSVKKDKIEFWFSCAENGVKSVPDRIKIYIKERLNGMKSEI